jgi:hypothetical protein
VGDFTCLISASELAKMDLLWFRSGLALSKWFLCPSPASHKGHENSGKNYHQQANNNPRKFPDSALCLNCSFFFRHTSRFPRVKARAVA